MDTMSSSVAEVENSEVPGVCESGVSNFEENREAANEILKIATDARAEPTGKEAETTVAMEVDDGTVNTSRRNSAKDIERGSAECRSYLIEYEIAMKTSEDVTTVAADTNDAPKSQEVDDAEAEIEDGDKEEDDVEEEEEEEEGTYEEQIAQKIVQWYTSCMIPGGRSDFKLSECKESLKVYPLDLLNRCCSTLIDSKKLLLDTSVRRIVAYTIVPEEYKRLRDAYEAREQQEEEQLRTAQLKAKEEKMSIAREAKLAMKAAIAAEVERRTGKRPREAGGSSSGGHGVPELLFSAVRSAHDISDQNNAKKSTIMRWVAGNNKISNSQSATTSSQSSSSGSDQVVDLCDAKDDSAGQGEYCEEEEDDELECTVQRSSKPRKIRRVVTCEDDDEDEEEEEATAPLITIVDIEEQQTNSADGSNATATTTASSVQEDDGSQCTTTEVKSAPSQSQTNVPEISSAAARPDSDTPATKGSDKKEVTVDGAKKESTLVSISSTPCAQPSTSAAVEQKSVKPKKNTAKTAVSKGQKSIASFFKLKPSGSTDGVQAKDLVQSVAENTPPEALTQTTTATNSTAAEESNADAAKKVPSKKLVTITSAERSAEEVAKAASTAAAALLVRKQVEHCLHTLFHANDGEVVLDELVKQSVLQLMRAGKQEKQPVAEAAQEKAVRDTVRSMERDNVLMVAEGVVYEI